MTRPSLIIQSVYFDESDRDTAARLATELYGLLTRPLQDPLAVGPGIPVLGALAPPHVKLDAADELIILPVLGSQTHLFEDSRTKALETIASWQQKLGAGHVIPVPTSSKWQAQHDLAGTNRLTNLYDADAANIRILDEIVLATLQLLNPKADKPQLFISHAKAEHPADNAAATAIRDYVSQGTTGNIFDISDLSASRSRVEQFGDSPKNGVFIAIRSDSYSSRNWCQKELLLAKQNALPTLTVDILDHGETLSSPYAGNGPTMLWHQDPQPVVSRALVECLRAAHFRKEAERMIQRASLPHNALPLCRPPELLDLVQGPINANRAQLVIYPDPELHAVHRNLLAMAKPHLTLATPTTAFRRIGAQRSTVSNPFDNLQVSLSLSESPDVDGPEGYSENHVKDATVYLARSLISAGAHIAYGGDFRQAGYTEILSNLIASYREVAGTGDMLHSYLASCVEVEDIPDELAITVHHMDRAPLADNARLPSRKTQPLPSSLNPLYYSDMRRAMVDHTGARFILGGESKPAISEINQRGYHGRYPGVVEEAWRSLQIAQPLYVAGGFGGAAAIVATLLQGGQTPATMQDASWTIHPSFKARADALDHSPYRETLGLPDSIDDLAKQLRLLGAKLLANDDTARAWNGLNVEQNQQLFHSRDAIAIATLVFTGLQNVVRQQHRGKLEIELVHGNITSGSDIDAVAVGAFDDMPLGGAGAAIDRLLAGRATLARAGGETLIGLDSGELAANWLYFASLGPFKQLDDIVKRVEEAARNTADQTLRHGFSRLGVVAFGSTLVSNPKQSARALVNGLQPLAGQSTVVWFESNPKQFERLHALLQQDERVKVTTREIPQPESAQQRSAAQQVIISVSLENNKLTSRAMLPTGTGVGGINRQDLTEPELDKLSKGRRGRRTPGAGALQQLGADIGKLLLGAEADTLLAACPNAKVTVFHDTASSRLPFESLSAHSDKAPLRPAVRGGINRRLAVSDAGFKQLLAKPPHTGRLKVLLVVNPELDLVSADIEGKAVKNTLADHDNIELIELWHENATIEALLNRLKTADVLHYCGHAFYDGPGEQQSGLNLNDGELYFTRLQGHNFPTRLVFANACESGRVRSSPDTHESASFAEYFLRSGIEAYLGTHWRVADGSAADFAASVYSDLARGDTLDQAVRHGREQLMMQNKNEWANYILYGEGQFQLVTR